MAEKYGEIPKRFTVAWWQYFWMYYKWHTIGTLVVILMIVITAVQCASREKDDLNVNYAGTQHYSEDVITALETELKSYVPDADGNGDVNVFVQQLNFANTAASAEMDYTLQVKHDVELSNDISFLYLYDETQANIMANRESASDIYMSLTDWMNDDASDVINTKEGAPVMVSVKGSRILENAGFNTEGLYMAVRLDYSGEEKSRLSQQGAIESAKKILEK